LFRNRTELGEADAETGQPACAVAHFLPVRLPPRVAVLLEQVEDLGLCHGTSLLSTDPRQRATWQGSRTMAGAKEHFPRWQPWVLCALRRCRRSARPRCRSGVGHCALAEYSTLLLQAGAPSPTSASSPDIGTPRSLRVYAHWLPDVSRRVDRLDPLQPDATPAQPEAVPTTNRPSVSRLF
jgi:hypothetical protein